MNPLYEHKMMMSRRHFFGLGSTIFSKIKIQLLFDALTILRQLQSLQLVIKVLLDRSLADSLGKLPDGRANVHAGQRLLHRGSFTVSNQRDRCVLKISQRGGLTAF